MPHLKRLLWLAAWCVWLYLGFGLHRELPRSLGPPLCVLHFVDVTEVSQGFLEGGKHLLTRRWGDHGVPLLFRVLDAETGAVVRELNGPLESGRQWDDSVWPRQWFVIGASRPDIAGRPPHDGFSALDLRTGIWTDLPDGCVGRHHCHDSKPWAVFYRYVEDGQCSRVNVVDLRTGRLLFTWDDDARHQSKRQLYERPAFVGDSLLALPVAKSREGAEPGDYRLELWSIPPGDAPLKEYRDVRLHEAFATLSGRIATHDDEGRVQVFDVHQGRFVLWQDPLYRDPNNENGLGGYTFPNKKGTTVVGGNDLRLIEVDSGRALWQVHRVQELGPFEKREVLHKLLDDGPLVIEEDWSADLGGERRLETCALRDFDTGRLRYRFYDPDHSGKEISSDGRLLYLNDDHTIRRLPPPANWSLLLLCQSILALPLLLTWALRWRRRRAQPAEAPA